MTIRHRRSPWLALSLVTTLVLAACSEDPRDSGAELDMLGGETTTPTTPDAIDDADDDAPGDVPDSTAKDISTDVPELDTSVDLRDTPDASPLTCRSDNDCTAHGLLCDPLTEVCVECLSDSHCGALEHCRDRRCEGFTPCASSLDCASAPGAPICDEALSECVECVFADDCTAPATCTNNTCVPYTPCLSSRDCPHGEVCDEARNRCAACVFDNDCGPSQHCTNYECVPFVACVSDNNCTSLGLLCDRTVGECRECLQHAHCPDAYHCADGACVIDVCVPARTICSGNAVAQCSTIGDGFETPVPCGANESCTRVGLDATCQAHVCTPGLSCNDELLVECSEDGLTVTTTTDCAARGLHCRNGACVAQVCTPSSLFCDGSTVMACDAAGLTISTSDVCAAGEYCDESTGTAVCAAQVCAPNQPACDGSIATTCNVIGSGYLAGGVDCLASGQGCSNGACVRAAPVYRYSRRHVPGACPFPDETHNLATGTSALDCSGWGVYAAGQLVDGVRGFDNYQLNQSLEWVAWQTRSDPTDMSVLFDFGVAIPVGQVVVGMSNYATYGIQQAKEIRIAHSSDGTNWSTPHTFSIAAGTLPVAPSRTRADFVLNLNSTTVRRYWSVSFVADAEWTLVDEIEFN